MCDGFTSFRNRFYLSSLVASRLSKNPLYIHIEQHTINASDYIYVRFRGRRGCGLRAGRRIDNHVYWLYSAMIVYTCALWYTCGVCLYYTYELGTHVLEKEEVFKINFINYKAYLKHPYSFQKLVLVLVKAAGLAAASPPQSQAACTNTAEGTSSVTTREPEQEGEDEAGRGEGGTDLGAV